MSTKRVLAAAAAGLLMAAGLDAMAQTPPDGAGAVPPDIKSLAPGDSASAQADKGAEQKDPGAYPLKGGGFYKAPAQPFRSPAMDTSMDDRT